MNTSWLLYQYPFLSKVGRWVVPAAPCHLFRGLENSLRRVELTTIGRESVFWLKPSFPGLSLVKTVQLLEDRRGKTIKEEKKEGPFAPTYMCTHMHCTHTHTHTRMNTYKQKMIVQRKRGEKKQMEKKESKAGWPTLAEITVRWEVGKGISLFRVLF